MNTFNVHLTNVQNNCNIEKKKETLNDVFLKFYNSRNVGNVSDHIVHC